MPTKANAINESTTGVSGFTGTAFTGTPVTQHNVLIGGATSSTITNVTPSTAGFVLTSNGAAADPSFQAATGGGGSGSITLIQSQTASGATSLPFTTLSGFNNFILIGDSIEATQTGSAFGLQIQISTNGGASYINTGYISQSATPSPTTGMNIGQYLVTNVAGTGVVSTNATLYDFTAGGAANFPATTCTFMPWDGATAVSGAAETAVYPTASTVVNAFQIVLSNGGTFSGNFTLYGISTTGGGGGQQSVTLNLTNSQIKNLRATPIQILAAQGANTLIVPKYIIAFLNYGGSNAFVNPASAGTIEMYYTNTNTGNTINFAVMAQASYTQTTSNYQLANGSFSPGTPTASCINQPIFVAIDQAASGEITGNAANDNTITIRLEYEVLTVPL